MLNRKYLFVAVCWTISVFYLSFREKIELPSVEFDYADKIVHFVLYFLFVWFWFQGTSYNTLNKKLLKQIVVFGIIISVIVEIGQETLTSNRHFDWFDIVANSLGALTAYFYFNRIETKLFSK